MLNLSLQHFRNDFSLWKLKHAQKKLNTKNISIIKLILTNHQGYTKLILKHPLFDDYITEYLCDVPNFLKFNFEKQPKILRLKIVHNKYLTWMFFATFKKPCSTAEKHQGLRNQSENSKGTFWILTKLNIWNRCS